MGEAQAVGHDRDGDREARVQVVRRHVGQPDAGHLQRRTHGGHRRRRDAQVGTAHQLTVAQVAVSAQVDPLLPTDPELGRDPLGGQHQRGGLVDLVARDDRLGVGVDDHPVGLGDRDDLLGGPRLPHRGVRVLGGLGGERREERAHLLGQLGAGEPEPRAARVLEERVLRRGVDQTVPGLVARGDPLEPRAPVPVAALDGLAEVGLVLAPGEVEHGRDRLGAGDHSDGGDAGGDLGAQLGDQVLGRLAARDLVDDPLGVEADAARDRAWEVVRASQRRGHPGERLVELPRARHDVDPRPHGGVGAGVVERETERARRQVDGRERLVGLLPQPLRELRGTHQDRDVHRCAARGAHRRGSTRILACASGLPRSAKACATPSRPTVPVINGVGSTLPSASRCSDSRNSAGV